MAATEKTPQQLFTESFDYLRASLPPEKYAEARKLLGLGYLMLGGHEAAQVLHLKDKESRGSVNPVAEGVQVHPLLPAEAYRDILADDFFAERSVDTAAA